MRNSHALLVLAVLFILSGSILLLENCGLITGISRLWPLFILFLGSGFLLLFFERGGNDPVLLWFGTVLCLVSIFFGFLNYTSWQEMTRLWPVFLGICAAGFLSVYIFFRRILFLHLSLSFFLLFLIFYLVFGVSLALWPTSLIFFGLSLIIINYSARKG